MRTLKHVPLIIFAAFLFTPLAQRAGATRISGIYNSLEARYSRAHSLGDNYQFRSQDGWQTVNVTNLQYKYSRSLDESDETGSQATTSEPAIKKRAKKSTKKSKSKTTVSAASNNKSASTSKVKSFTASLKAIVSSMKAIGKAEPVTITWYTGHDLLNPSCWSDPTWAPTDASFACALTLEGWTTRPKCFKFLELCNTPQKCVFVRVVDSCAGCAKGSKHVDLTQAAFSQLASLDTGLMQVQMRQATDPVGWVENLWGPKV